MMTLIIALHGIICILLIAIILIQAGRGGGLVEGFSGVESMFGTKTSSFLTRTTTTLAVLFFITCVSLALLSARQSRSLMKDLKEETTTPKTTENTPAKENIPTAVPLPENPPEVPKAE